MAKARDVWDANRDGIVDLEAPTDYLVTSSTQCSTALTVKCGPRITCASIGFPGLCCSKWGVSTLFDVPLFGVPNAICTIVV